MNQDFDRYRSEVISESAEREGGRSSFRRVLLDVLETLIISAVLFLAINAVSARIRVDGFSMEPSLHSGEFVIVNKLAYRFTLPKRGEVIVFHFPRDPEQEYIKRVIGLPGDEVVISGRQVRVNDQELDEPYILQPPAYSGSWQVPEDSLFVLGDNRNNSSDSHNWGPVALEHIVGKALFVYWPIEEWGLVQHTAPESASP